MERKPFLRIIPQAYRGGDAEIVGDRTALELLIEGLEEALDEGVGSSGPFSDGEREFEVRFVFVPAQDVIEYDRRLPGRIARKLLLWDALMPYHTASGRIPEWADYPAEQAAWVQEVRAQEVYRECLKEWLREERKGFESKGFPRGPRGCFWKEYPAFSLNIHAPGTAGDQHAWMVGEAGGGHALVCSLHWALSCGEFKGMAFFCDVEGRHYHLFLRMVEEGSEG